jgi:hypothetical protein
MQNKKLYEYINSLKPSNKENFLENEIDGFIECFYESDILMENYFEKAEKMGVHNLDELDKLIPSAEFDELRTIITFIVRRDRIDEGLLARTIKKGIMGNILKRLFELEKKHSFESLSFSFNYLKERDMDILFLEEIITDVEFLDLFLRKINFSGATYLDAYHSMTDIMLGESDLTIIVEKNNVKHALLIENKIDAMNMPEQYNRYVSRGKLGINNKTWDSFDVFIIAPNRYLENNAEATKYPNKISYETLIDYLFLKNDIRALFKAKMIFIAVQKEQSSYVTIKHDGVTQFWNDYYDYVNNNHPNLSLKKILRDKGAKAEWVSFNTHLDKTQIYHKLRKGFIDFQMDGKGDHIEFLNKSLVGRLDNNMMIVKAGKSACIRIKVPELNHKTNLWNQRDKLVICFDSILLMNEFVLRLKTSDITPNT